MNKDKITLLLLSAGTNACYHTARIIKLKFGERFRIVGADVNPAYLISTAPYLDAFYRVPYSADAAYYGTVLSVIRQEKVQFLLPSFDRDQQLFYPENPDLTREGAVSLGTPGASLAIYADKRRMYDHLKQCGLPVPSLFSENELNDAQTYFIKPLDGVGSSGARAVTGREIKNRSDAARYLVQEVCSAPEYTLECFYYRGRLSSVCRERLAAKAGVCVKARVFNKPDLHQIARRFAGSLACPLCFNLQFMYDRNARAVITDVNLRLAGGMSLSYACGWDEVSALAQTMLNASDEEVFKTLPDRIPSQYVVRAYTDLVTGPARPVLALDWDGTLLDSQNRHRSVLDRVLERHNLTADTSGLLSFKREGHNNTAFLRAAGLSDAQAEAVQEAWLKEIESPAALQEDRLYPDALDFVRQAGQTYDLALITARRDRAALLAQLKESGLAPFFKAVYVVPPGKTAARDKAEKLEACGAVGFIGDTETDCSAALTAGITFWALNRGFRSKAYWHGRGLESYASLADILPLTEK